MLRLTGTPNDRPPVHHLEPDPHPGPREPDSPDPSQGEGTINRALAHLLALTLAVLAAVAVVLVADSPASPHPQLTHLGAPGFHERCPAAQKAISFYRGKYREHREKMNATGPVPRQWYPCDAARRRAKQWHARAAEALTDYKIWHASHWEWTAWLPDKWQRIGACETGYGQRPGNWRHNSGSYQGAFGFANQSWDSFVDDASPAYGPYPANADEATPRQQYEVALAIYRRYGLSGWGCRAA